MGGDNYVEKNCKTTRPHLSILDTHRHYGNWSIYAG